MFGIIWCVYACACVLILFVDLDSHAYGTQRERSDAPTMALPCSSKAQSGFMSTWVVCVVFDHVYMRVWGVLMIYIMIYIRVL